MAQNTCMYDHILDVNNAAGFQVFIGMQQGGTGKGIRDAKQKQACVNCDQHPQVALYILPSSQQYPHSGSPLHEETQF